jgi:hypothetical protein
MIHGFDLILIILNILYFLFELVLTAARLGIAAFRWSGRSRIGTRVREWPPWIWEPRGKYRKFTHRHYYHLILFFFFFFFWTDVVRWMWCRQPPFRRNPRLYPPALNNL